jgi:hypothetical protein
LLIWRGSKFCIGMEFMGLRIGFSECILHGWRLVASVAVIKSWHMDTNSGHKHLYQSIMWYNLIIRLRRSLNGKKFMLAFSSFEPVIIYAPRSDFRFQPIITSSKHRIAHSQAYPPFHSLSQPNADRRGRCFLRFADNLPPSPLPTLSNRIRLTQRK